MDQIASRASDRLQKIATLNAEAYSDLVVLITDRAKLIARVAELECEIERLQNTAVQPNSERLLSMTEVRSLLGLGATKVWSLVANGTFHKVKIGRLTRVTSASVDAYINRIMVGK
jgi:excisionase family DNA binding protein